MAHALFVGSLEHPYINPLEMGGYVWSQTGVFRDPVYINYFLANDYAEWTPREATAYVTALQSWANVANIRIGAAETAAGSDLIAHNVSADLWGDGTLGEHGTPMDAFQTDPVYDGDILLSTHNYAHGYFNWEAFGWDYNDPNGGLNVGGYGYWTLVHELGHGLGLSHPFDNGGGGGLFPGVPAGSDGFDRGQNGLNQGVWTVMSYNALQSTATANSEGRGDDAWSMGGVDVSNYGYFAGPMALDIAAIQDLYGANTNFHNGGDTYVLPDENQLGTYYTCLWDTGGTDSISYSGNRNVTISLIAATLDNSRTGGGVISAADNIHGGYTIANGVVIENAYAGNGNDTLEGNGVANYISGGGGADRMTGWGGNDTYSVDNVGDVVVEDANRGTDRVNTTLTSYTLGYQVEEVNYLGPSTADFRGTGNQLDNTILAWNGNDTLDGMSGADRMRGYDGNDTFSVDNVGDVVEEYAGQGDDTVRTSLSTYSLAVNVETLDYRGPSTANFRGTGNGLDNTILGWNGNDDLDGLNGADRMVGYAGSDTYWVDDAGDAVVEGANAGSDWINTTLTSYTLSANVEGVQSWGIDTASFRGTGNALDNDILSYDGDDILDGKGGADDLIGNGGNDRYYVDNAGDMVVDSLGQGASDRVVSSTSYVLAAGQEIEILSMVDSARRTGNSLTGNEFGQLLNGDMGNNTLNGLDGADTLYGYGGKDTLFGGKGADTFVFKALTDTRAALSGADIIKAFSHAQGDRIDLHALDANGGLAGNQGFSFIGGAQFGHHAGELRAVVSGGDTIVSGDVNGDAAADFSIVLDGTVALQRGDFIL